jgi:hypothetical protein
MDHHPNAHEPYKYNSQQEIHERSGERYEKIVGLWIPQVVGVNWHRFCPTDKKAGLKKNHEERNNHRADHVDVNQRVERNAALEPGGIIAAFPGHPGVAELMEGEQDHQADIHEQAVDELTWIH